MIEVSFRHEDPQVAANVVNLLVELFREKHLKVFSDPQSSFLEKQLQIYRTKLGTSEQSMQSFKQKNQVYSLDEQRSLLLKQRTELDSTLKNTDHRIDELREKLRSLNNREGDKRRQEQEHVHEHREGQDPRGRGKRNSSPFN